MVQALFTKTLGGGRTTAGNVVADKTKIMDALYDMMATVCTLILAHVSSIIQV